MRSRCAWYYFGSYRSVPIVQRPRTWPFQGQNPGSNPGGDANPIIKPHNALAGVWFVVLDGAIRRCAGVCAGGRVHQHTDGALLAAHRIAEAYPVTFCASIHPESGVLTNRMSFDPTVSHIVRSPPSTARAG